MTKTQNNTISVLKNSSIKLSLKFGFLGLGMGGSSIAAACSDIQTNVTNNRYPYTSLLVNTNSVDLSKVDAKNPSTKKLVIGTGRGAGRNITEGESMFKQDYKKVEEEFNKQFSDRDFLWIVAGLGGGTGTGSIIEAIRLVYTSNFKGKFGLILTLPMNKDGDTVLKNAVSRLNTISKAMNGLGSIILIDNQKLYDHFITDNKTAGISEFLDYSNQYVAEMLHELNTVTSSFTPVGSDHFDASEFENLIKTPGILHFARLITKSTDVDSSQVASYSTRLKERIHQGVLSDGYDITDADRAAVSILANPSTSKRLFNIEFLQEINTIIDNEVPFAKEKPVAAYTYPYKNSDEEYHHDVYFYAVFAGLQFPKRIIELIGQVNSIAERDNSKVAKKDIFGSLDSTIFQDEKPKDLSFEELFSAPSKEQPEEDPLAALFGPKNS